jgi:nicotinamide mononucleotide transporter
LKEVIDSFVSESIALGHWEIIAVVAALIYVTLAAKANRWCFLFGFISSSIYIYLSAKLAFYYDTLINVYYVLMSIYGWFAWSNQKKTDTRIQVLGKNKFSLLIGIGIGITIVFALVSRYFLAGSLPYFDSFTTVFSFIATWMVIKKHIENWLIWIFVDFTAAFMYLHKGLYLTFLLFIIYTIIAIFGYLKWKKQFHQFSK